MKKDDLMPETGTLEENSVSQADEKKGKLLIYCSSCLFMLPLMLNLVFKFNQHVLFLFGGIVMMYGGILQYKGFKLLKNNALGNLPIWEAVFGGLFALTSIAFLAFRL